MSGLVLLGGLTSCGSDPSAPAASAPPPAHHTTSAARPPLSGPIVRTALDTEAADILRAAHARIGELAVVADHPERRAATWYTCRDPHCYRHDSAAVVTADGFRHRAIVDLPVRHDSFGYSFQPAGPDHFVVSVNGGHRRLVDLHGHVEDFTIAGPMGPLAPGEVAVGGKGYRHWLGLDPRTARAHPLSTPRDTQELVTTPDGQLRALTVHLAYAWSADGGSTWHPMQMPNDDRQLMVGMIPSGDDSVQAVQVGGDGATYFPWDHVLKSTDGRTWTSYDGPTGPRAYADPVAVLPDGRLVLDVHAWSDERGSRPSPHPLGLYAGADWGGLSPVRLSGPFASQDPHTFDPTTFDVAVTTRSVTLYAQTPEQTGVVASTDGGMTWHSVRAR